MCDKNLYTTIFLFDNDKFGDNSEYFAARYVTEFLTEKNLWKCAGYNYVKK